MALRIMNAPGGSRYLHARHFTTPGKGAMHNQSTDIAPTKIEIALELIRAGVLSIDENGKIWRHSRRRTNGKVHVYPEPRRADHADHLGYCRLSVHLEGKTYIVYAHQLVWAFHNGPVLKGLEINHKDGNKENNAIGNLEVVTRKQNQRHAADVTRSWDGREIAPRVMNAEKVAELRAKRQTGASYDDLAAEYGISRVTVQQIVYGTRWAWVN